MLNTSPASNARCATTRSRAHQATPQANASHTVYSGSMMNTLDHIAGRTGSGHSSCVP